MLRQRRVVLASSKVEIMKTTEEADDDKKDKIFKKQQAPVQVQDRKFNTEGFVADFKELLSEGKRLADSSPLSLITRLKTLASSLEFKDRVDLNTFDTILDAKRKIQREMGIPIKQQILVCRGQELDDNSKTLEAYNIQGHDRIYVIFQPRR